MEARENDINFLSCRCVFWGHFLMIIKCNWWTFFVQIGKWPTLLIKGIRVNVYTLVWSLFRIKSGHWQGFKKTAVSKIYRNFLKNNKIVSKIHRKYFYRSSFFGEVASLKSKDSRYVFMKTHSECTININSHKTAQPCDHFGWVFACEIYGCRFQFRCSHLHMNLTFSKILSTF